MTSFFNGSGVVVRSDGTRSGEDVWAQAKAASVKILSADHDTHDQGIADSIEDCLNRRGENSPTTDIPWGSNKITGLKAGTLAGDAAQVAQVQAGMGSWAGTAGGTANAIALTVSPAITAYVAGMTFRFIAAATNTSFVTLSVSGVTDSNLSSPNIQALQAGQIVIGSEYVVTYDGTQFILWSPERSVFYGPNATTSGTTASFNVLLGSQIKRLTLMLDAVSGDGTDNLELVLGDAGGVETAGYDVGGTAVITGTNTCLTPAALGDAVLVANSLTAGSTVSGVVTITRMVASTKWAIVVHTSKGTAGVMHLGYTTKELSDGLTTLRLQWSGTDDFDAGAVSLLVEYA